MDYREAIENLHPDTTKQTHRHRLQQYGMLKKEIASLEESIERLRTRAMEIPTVMGKVSGSSYEFPYIQRHFTVQMDEPKESDMISKRIRIKEKRKAEAEQLASEIEEFIASIADSTNRQSKLLRCCMENGKKLDWQVNINAVIVIRLNMNILQKAVLNFTISARTVAQICERRWRNDRY